jgi:cyclophilin family peptidyl-prolyl cis-trans isomerase
MSATKTIATIETAKGKIEVELYPEKAPKTVQNFLDKAASGYYKGLNFHRVEDWVIQGGDPLGNGTGGGKMETELNDVPFVDGSLGVARGGDIRVSNDSQFFICTKDCGWLDGQYTNFGKVISGLDIAKKVAVGDKILSISTK